jgi:hypothetical protein
VKAIACTRTRLAFPVFSWPLLAPAQGAWGVNSLPNWVTLLTSALGHAGDLLPEQKPQKPSPVSTLPFEWDERSSICCHCQERRTGSWDKNLEGPFHFIHSYLPTVLYNSPRLSSPFYRKTSRLFVIARTRLHSTTTVSESYGLLN